jgi:hypothetical protein
MYIYTRAIYIYITVIATTIFTRALIVIVVIINIFINIQFTIISNSFITIITMPIYTYI